VKCDGCGSEHQALRGAVVNGKYGDYCSTCISGTTRQANPASAQYHRDRDREDNAKDLLQPWDANGVPNTEFIRNYPEESKDMFTDQELEQHG
jgi:hypothetical protein